MKRNGKHNGKHPGGLIPAAGYIRMSGRSQEKSPAEQKAEITKLAGREGCRIVEWFADEAVTGDSDADGRPGLAGLLEGARAGRFQVVLAWHTNRLSREDPMDALVFYNQLRKAAVGLVTCCEGRIDLDDFSKQLLLFVNQKGSHDYLVEHSAKTLRGKVAAAMAGTRNGGVIPYAMERGLFDSAGKLIRRLAPGEAVRLPDHVVRTLPTTDPTRLAAVRFVFERYDQASLSIRRLTRELEAKGYPPPPSGQWTPGTVAGILRNPVYCGTTRWGQKTVAKYHRPAGSDIVAVNRNGNGKKRLLPKPPEEWLLVPGSHQGIIPAPLFKRVQAKLPHGPKRERRPKATYPLSGLLFCEHCGVAMTGSNERGRVGYTCTTYLRRGRKNATGCGRHKIDAADVQAWLVEAIRRYYLGPGRDELVTEVKRRLAKEAKVSKVDTRRLEKRAAQLDREVGRLVKAIRTLDAPELVEELAAVRRERQGLQDSLQQAGRYQHGQETSTRRPRP